MCLFDLMIVKLETLQRVFLKTKNGHSLTIIMYGLGRLDLIVCKFHLARLKLFSGAKAQSNCVCSVQAGNFLWCLFRHENLRPVDADPTICSLSEK